MPITQIIDDLDNLIGSGAPPAKLRLQLAVLREQAEAMEAQANQLKLETDAGGVQRTNEVLKLELEHSQAENKSLKDRIVRIQEEQQNKAEGNAKSPFNGKGANPFG